MKRGSFYEQDGESTVLSASLGIPFDRGKFNVASEWRESDPTVRSEQIPDAQALIDAGNTHVPGPVAQIWGLPSVSNDYKVFANMTHGTGDNGEFYAFGNYSERETEGGFYYRRPHTRRGVFISSHNGDFITANDEYGRADECPSLHVSNGRVVGLEELERSKCHSLLQKFPGGFTPRFGAAITDTSLAAGWRGTTSNGWRWDMSTVRGSNKAAFTIRNTVNPQLIRLGEKIPTSYYAGAYTSGGWTTNFDFDRLFHLETGIQAINVAFGAEYRTESFAIDSGHPTSYYASEHPEDLALGLGVGSNGFQGFSREDELSRAVYAYAAYTDIEFDFTDRFTAGTAVRRESHEEFGHTLDAKFTARLDFTDSIAFRTAASTGFRIPTTGQAFMRNTLTAFRVTEDGSGRLVDTRILPPTHPDAMAKGATRLVPERSVNLSAGIVFDIGGLGITADYYHIGVTDRITLSCPFPESLATCDTPAGFVASGEVRFFTNHQDLDVDGIDVVASWPFALWSGASTLSLATNLSNVRLTDYDPRFTEPYQMSEIQDGKPKTRTTASWRHDAGKWRSVIHIRYYGEYYNGVTGGEGWGAYWPEPITLVDLKFEFDVGDSLVMALAAKNIFDRYPERNPNDGVPAFNGLPWPENSPMGFSGGSYYIKATWSTGHGA